MSMRGMIFRALPLALLLAVSAAASQAQAAHLITFTRGQSIVVQSAEKRGNWYYFTLDGGGEMGVLASQVARVEDYEAPPPSALASTTEQPTPSPGPAAAPQGAPVDNNGGQQMGAVGADQQAVAAQPAGEPTANVMSRGDDWRFRVKMSGGPSIQPGGAGGMRKPPGMGGGAGRGGIQNGANQNPYNRRTPPPQTGNPTP